MLFEVRPDVFPQGFVTETEMHLWDLYLTDLNASNPHG
jgi:hypothetical protein